MGAASGSYKQIRIKEQPTAKTLPGPTGARIVARTDGVFNLQKQAFTNDRISTRFQPNENRHGVQSSSGNIVDHLSPGHSADLLGAALKRAFASVAAMTGLSITIAAGVEPNTYTVTRSAGSWITSGLRIGMCFRLTAGAFNPANLNKTLAVLDLTATIATVRSANGSALVAEGPIATATATIPGKYSYLPTSGHTEKMFTVEEWHPDVPYSEVYGDQRVSSVALDIPATGNANITVQMEGGALLRKDPTVYFTSPTPEPVVPPATGVNGVLRSGGISIPVTGCQINYGTPYSGDPTLGSNTLDFKFPETPTLTGSLSAYFTGGELPAVFYDETVTTLDLFLPASSDAACEVIAVSLPRIKLDSADKNGGKGGVVRSYNFSASENQTVGAREGTALAIHDTLA